MTPAKLAATSAVFCLIFSAAAAADDKGRKPDGAELDLGRTTLIQAGCVGCHSIPETGAFGGNVGPPLAGIGRHIYLAGLVPNTKQGMVRWITHAQEIHPGDAMPSTPLSPEQAEAVADYLESLK